MDAILQAAGIVNPEPIRHPDIPGRAISVGYFIKHTEGADPCGIAHTC